MGGWGGTQEIAVKHNRLQQFKNATIVFTSALGTKPKTLNDSRLKWKIIDKALCIFHM